MSVKVLESNNYGRFELTAFNRDVNKTRHLETSMRKHGWIDAYPAHVIRNGNNKLLIKAGHHRYVVAMKLGIPVKYVECSDEATIHELEKATKLWTMQDYLNSFARLGKSAYLTVRDYQERTGMPLNACISMLAGRSAGSGSPVISFKDGTFRIGNQSHARVVEGIITQARVSGYPYWKNMSFISAISKSCWAEGFSSEVMKDKIKAFVHFMKKQATGEEYLEMLESVYNRQSHDKIPLKFLAEMAAKKRNVTFK